MFGRGGEKPQQSGQQRRSKANTKALREGQAAMDRSSRSTTAWHTERPSRPWWRTS